jgi:hypothetical protein
MAGGVVESFIGASVGFNGVTLTERKDETHWAIAKLRILAAVKRGLDIADARLAVRGDSSDALGLVDLETLYVNPFEGVG